MLSDQVVGSAEGTVPQPRLERGQRKSMEETGGTPQIYTDRTGSTV